jgi:hypothetical protein
MRLIRFGLTVVLMTTTALFIVVIGFPTHLLELFVGENDDRWPWRLGRKLSKTTVSLIRGVTT